MSVSLPLLIRVLKRSLSRKRGLCSFSFLTELRADSLTKSSTKINFPLTEIFRVTLIDFFQSRGCLALRRRSTRRWALSWLVLVGGVGCWVVLGSVTQQPAYSFPMEHSQIAYFVIAFKNGVIIDSFTC